MYDAFGKLHKKSKTLMPNLSLYYLAGLVGDLADVSVVDETISDIDFEEQVDMVGISCNTINAKRAYEVAECYRRKNVTVVLGGIHPSLKPEEAAKYADAVVIGEAEETLPRLIRDFKINRLEKKYLNTTLNTLRNLPHPNFGLIDEKKHLRFKGSYVLPIETSRGCPINCEFCSVTKLWGKTMRYKPIDKVVEEIKSSGAKLFFFTDDNFNFNPSRTKKLCRALIPLKIQYVCQINTRISKNPGLIELLKKSGCIATFIGFESMKKRVLTSTNKSINNPDSYNKIFELLTHAGINIYASIIFGFDGDRQADVIKTVDYLLEKKCSLASFFKLTPYPGTELYEKVKNANRLVDENWWLKTDDTRIWHNKIKYPNGDPTGEELTRIAKKRFNSFTSVFRRFSDLKKHKLFLLPLNLKIAVDVKRNKTITM